MFSIQDLSDVASAVWVDGLAVSIGLVVLPLALELVAVGPMVLSLAIRNIVLDISVIIATITFDESAFPIASSVLERPFQKVSVVEVEFSVAIRLVTKLFPNVLCL